MFLRTTKAKNNNYVSIVKAYRDLDGKPKQKIVKNLGAFKTDHERDKLYTLGQNLIKSMQGETLFTSSDITELRRENWGAAAVMDRLFEIYKLEKLFDDLTSERKLEYDLISAIKFMLATRFIEPMSKLASFNKLKDFSGFTSFSLQHLYRSLDELHRYENEIKSHLFSSQKTLSREDLDVVFFDVTTLSFESQQSDELRNFGFSKDCKFNETQILLSLLITSDGRPIGYEIFPGNHYEGSTLLTCLDKLRERYQIKKVVIVADRGLSSFKNLQAIKDRGFDYIIASRMGHLSKKMQSNILDTSDYKALCEVEDDKIYYKNLSIERNKLLKNESGETEKQVLSEQLLCLYSNKRAEKDRKDRDRLIKKASEMLESGRCYDKRGARKYLKINQVKLEALDIEKIKNDEISDGFYIIGYSDPRMDPARVVSAYRGLWKIEASFRSMKNFFETRPIFHWSKERISGHILLNFICLVFEKFIEQMISIKNSSRLSEQEIRMALRGLERSVIDIQGTQSFLYSSITPSQSILLEILKIKKPL